MTGPPAHPRRGRGCTHRPGAGWPSGTPPRPGRCGRWLWAPGPAHQAGRTAPSGSGGRTSPGTAGSCRRDKRSPAREPAIDPRHRRPRSAWPARQRQCAARSVQSDPARLRPAAHSRTPPGPRGRRPARRRTRPPGVRPRLGWPREAPRTAPGLACAAGPCACRTSWPARRGRGSGRCAAGKPAAPPACRWRPSSCRRHRVPWLPRRNARPSPSAPWPSTPASDRVRPSMSGGSGAP